MGSYGRMPWQVYSQIPSQNSTAVPCQSTGTFGVSQETSKKATPKAKWTPPLTEMFITFCVEETAAGNRPNGHLNPNGWENVLYRMQQATAMSYKKEQLKNKWDLLKQEWGTWMILVNNETGLGWDGKKGTIDASPEWWNKKLKITPKAAKFRTRGPILPNEQSILFSDVVATGEKTWTPSCGVVPVHMRDGDNVDANINGREVENEMEDTTVETQPEEQPIPEQSNINIETTNVNDNQVPKTAQAQGPRTKMRIWRNLKKVGSFGCMPPVFS